MLGSNCWLKHGNVAKIDLTLHCYITSHHHVMWSLTHWGRATHIFVSKLTIMGSDNGLSPGRRQAIIWINARILLFRTLRINFSGIVSEIHTFSFKKMHLKMSSARWRPFCLGFNVLKMTMLWHGRSFLTARPLCEENPKITGGFLSQNDQ